MFTPMLNSSRSSLISVGSSYHSTDEPELGSLQGIWDYEEARQAQAQAQREGPRRTDSDFTLVGTDNGKVNSAAVPEESPAEVLKRLTGLTPADILAMHYKLVDMVLNPSPATALNGVIVKAHDSEEEKTNGNVNESGGQKSRVVSELSSDGHGDTVVSLPLFVER